MGYLRTRSLVLKHNEVIDEKNRDWDPEQRVVADGMSPRIPRVDPILGKKRVARLAISSPLRRGSVSPYNTEDSHQACSVYKLVLIHSSLTLLSIVLGPQTLSLFLVSQDLHVEYLSCASAQAACA